MRYKVTVPVWSDITLLVDAENKEDALEKGIREAVEKHPLVSWELDEDRIACDEDFEWLVIDLDVVEG